MAFGTVGGSAGGQHEWREVPCPPGGVAVARGHRRVLVQGLGPKGLRPIIIAAIKECFQTVSVVPFFHKSSKQDKMDIAIYSWAVDG